MLAAYNFVLTWADGFGGVSHDTLEWYLEKGEARLLDRETKDLIREGVDRLIAQDRRLAAEEMEKSKKK